MTLRIFLGLFAALGLSTFAGAAESHHHIKNAVYELREAKAELTGAAHDFGGHRKEALKAIDAAIATLELALTKVGDTGAAVKPGNDTYKNYKTHPHIREALHELRETRTQLQDAKHDWGGQRKQALQDVDFAIEQLKLCLAHINKEDKHHKDNIHMHHALHELQEARLDLKEAKHDFGGHRENALKAVDAAIATIELALEKVGDQFVGGEIVEKEGKGAHPHIHRAIHELKEVHTQLKEAKHDWGGLREQALKDSNYAVEQLELALKFAKK